MIDRIELQIKTITALHEAGEDCGHEDCQECCPHDEFDHYICLYCGYEKCPGDDIDAAEYSIDPER